MLLNLVFHIVIFVWHGRVCGLAVGLAMELRETLNIFEQIINLAKLVIDVGHHLVYVLLLLFIFLALIFFAILTFG